jgi:hypothetical protein
VDRAIVVDTKKQDLNLGSSSSDQQGIILPNPSSTPVKGKAVDVVDSIVVNNSMSKSNMGGEALVEFRGVTVL